MPLSSLVVFQEQVYAAATELMPQAVDQFNEASNGAIVLRVADHQGDFSEIASWAKIDGLVRRRNPAGSGAVTPVNIEHLLDRGVKVAGGTPPVRIDPGMLNWIGRDPEEAAAVVGLQLARDMLADMLNTAILAATAAMANVGATVVHDGTAGNASLQSQLSGAALFGDRASALAAWVLHSKSMFDIFGQALTNTAQLFSFGDVFVRTDGFGRPYIVTDSPSLMYTATGQKYRMLGLVPGAIVVDRNNDFTANVSTTNGDENIIRTYQAEWSYNLGLRGYAWDSTNGGRAPNDAALGTGTNWDLFASSVKDSMGVMVNVT